MAASILFGGDREVLVAAVDLSAASASVFEAALEVAHAAPHATIHLLHVTGTKKIAGGDPAEALAKWAERLPEAGATVELMAIDSDNAARAIVDYAAKVSADLILIGTHGRKGLSRILVGSVAEAVVRDAGCSVLIVRKKLHG